MHLPIQICSYITLQNLPWKGLIITTVYIAQFLLLIMIIVHYSKVYKISIIAKQKISINKQNRLTPILVTTYICLNNLN